MSKKALVIFSLVGALNVYADDNDDIKFIYKLYQNKEYKVSVEELNKFIVKYPSSKHYELAQNLLGQSLYGAKEYDKAQKIFGKLTNSSYGSDANYYLALINIELNNLDEAYKYTGVLKDINRERVLYTLAAKEYSNNNLLKAKEYFEEVRRQKGIYKNNALFNLGLISYNTGSYLDTTVYLDEYLNIEKEDMEKAATSNYILAFSYYKLNNKNLALDYYGNIEKNYLSSSYYNLAVRDLLFYWTEEKNLEKIAFYTEKLEGTQFAEVALQSTGNYYYNGGDYLKAISYYEKLVKNYNNIDAIYYLGRSYLNLNKNEEALKEFNKLSKVDKYKNEYFYYVAYIMFQKENYKEVITLLDGVETKLKKDLSNYYGFIADASYKLEDYGRAKKYYALVFNEKKGKDDFYKYYLVTSLAGDIKTLEELYDYYRKNYIKERTYSESVYLIMGNAYAKLNEDTKAVEVYSEGLKNEYSVNLLENLIIIQTKLKNYEEAYKSLNRLDISPEREFTKGTLLMNMKKYSEAIVVLDKLMEGKIEKDLKEKTLAKLAEVYLLEKNYAKTIETSEKYESSNKVFNKDIMNFKAIAYFRLGQFLKAREIYEKSLDSTTEKSNSFYMIGETYYNERNYLEAKKSYIKAYENTNEIKLKKDSAYWLIRVEEVLGNKKEFFERVEGFRKTFPDSEYNEDITYLVGKLYEESADRKKAIDEYSKLYNLSTNKLTKDEMAKRVTELYYADKDVKNAYLWNNKVNEEAYKLLWQGYILELEKKDLEANKNYEKLIKDKNYGDSANYKLGLYYLNKNDYKKARVYFEAVMNFEISINKERAQYNIGLTYEKEKDYLKAVSSFLRIKLLMENSDLEDLVLIKLGENYEKLENGEKSFEYFKEYYEKFSSRKDYSYVVEKLVVNRLNEDKTNEAKIYFNELEKINPENAKIYADYMK